MLEFLVTRARVLVFGAAVLTEGLAPYSHAADLEGPEVLPPTSAVMSEVERDTAQHPFFYHRLLLQGGASFTSITSSGQVGVAGGTGGTRISMEDDLGLVRYKTVFDALIRYRLSDRWSIEGSYFGLPRNNSATISRAIQWGRLLTFPASTSVSADFDMSIYRLAASFAFYKNFNTEVGLNASLNATEYQTSLAGSVSVGPLGTSFQSDKYGVTVPLPAIGLFASYAFSPQWLITARAEYMQLSLSRVGIFGLDLQDVKGRTFSAEATAEYRLFANLGIGVRYWYADVATGVTTSGLQGRLAYKLSARSAFLRLDF